MNKELLQSCRYILGQKRLSEDLKPHEAEDEDPYHVYTDRVKEIYVGIRNDLKHDDMFEIESFFKSPEDKRRANNLTELILEFIEKKQFSGYSVRLYDIYSELQKNATGGALDWLDLYTDAVHDLMIQKKKIDKVPPEVPPDAKDPIFGDYIFAPNRRGKVPNEPNTPREQEVFNDLVKHVKSNIPMRDETALDLMQVMDDGLYSNIIHEPKAQYIYRGMGFSRESFEAFLGGEALPFSGSRLVSKKISALFNPNRKERQASLSWTTDLKTAQTFSQFGSFEVIVVAKLSENPDTFVEGPNGFYDVPFFNTWSTENESIALGPVKLYKVYWNVDYQNIEEQN